MAKRVARVEIDFCLLASALGLPDDAEITGVREGYTFGGFEIRIEHKGLDPVEPGFEIPKVSPIVDGGTPPKFVKWLK